MLLDPIRLEQRRFKELVNQEIGVQVVKGGMQPGTLRRSL